VAVLSPAKIRDGIDRLVNWMKWPTAVLSVIALPAVGLASVKLATKIIAQPVPMFSFLGGAVAYALLWWWFIRHSRITFLQTLEHELTHALFALTTLHRVTRLRAAWSRGGHIEFVGSGNWLITAAPYFFPTVCVVLLPICAIVPGLTTWWGDILLGAAFAYHVTSTLRETHPGQSDLKQLGWLFCLAFLPTANLVALGSLLAFAHGGTASLWQFLASSGVSAMSILQ
jgi:hypothetical protein